MHGELQWRTNGGPMPLKWHAMTRARAKQWHTRVMARAMTCKEKGKYNGKGMQGDGQ